MTKKTEAGVLDVMLGAAPAEKAHGAGDVIVGPAQSGFVVEDMFSSIEALRGAKVEFVGVMPVEVPRQAKQYALLRVRVGRRTYRLILAFAEVVRPCPSGDEMWDLMETFFTAEEIRARYRHKPLELPKFEVAE